MSEDSTQKGTSEARNRGMGILYLVLLLAASLAGWLMLGQSARDPAPVYGGKPVVYATIYPLYIFARTIAGDEVQVLLAQEGDADPAYKAPGRDLLARMQEADLILCNGAGFESWLGRVTLPGRRIVDTAASLNADLIRSSGGVAHSHGAGAAHVHEGVNGHTWMDPLLALRQAEEIAAAFSKMAPVHADVFASRLAGLRTRLQELDGRWQALSAGALKGRGLLASHPTYDYLARRHGWNLQQALLDPGQLPDEATVQSLKASLAGRQVDTVLWEEEPTAAVREFFSKAMGLESVVVEPGETMPADGRDYFALMADNIRRLGGAPSAMGEELVLLDGKPLGSAEFKDWLIDHFADETWLENYISTVLFKLEGRKLGLEASAAEVDAAIDARVAGELEQLRMDPEGFKTMLDKIGGDEARLTALMRARYRAEMADDILAGKILRARSGVPEDELLALFEKKYGAGGREFKLRNIFKSIRPPYHYQGQPGFEEASQMEKVRAREILGRLAAAWSAEPGSLLASAEKIAAVDPDLAVQDYSGPAAQFPPAQANPQLAGILAGLKAGGTGPVLMAEDGGHLVHLRSRKAEQTDLVYAHVPLLQGVARKTEAWQEMRAAARAKLELAWDEIRGGAPFDKVAARESDMYSDASGSGLSSMRAISYGTLFTTALQRLKKGEMAILESDGGLHLVLLDDLVVTELNPALRAELEREICAQLLDAQRIVRLGVDLMTERMAWYDYPLPAVPR